MARPVALLAALAVALLPVSGAGGAGAQTPKRGGTVVVGIPDSLEPVCFNPLVPACVERGGTILLEILDGLILGRPFEVGPGFTFRPDLVSDATVRKSPFTITYHIRPAARWSDGVPVTASDFEFTRRAIRDTPSVWQQHPFRKITRTRIVDAKTFRVVVDSRLPVSLWKQWFVLLAPAHALSGVDLRAFWIDRVDDPRTGRPIASGPFVMQSRVRGREIVLARNARYWGPHGAYLDRLVFRFVRQDALAEALRTRVIDVILPVTQAELAALELRGAPPSGVRVVAGFSAAREQLQIRVRGRGHPALRDKRVRRALVFGVDRVALARALERIYGRSTPRLAPLDSMVFLPGSPHYQPNWSGYRRRPAEARRLLEQAGCRPGPDGVYVCGGEKLSLRVVTTAGVERRRLALELLRQQLGSIGIEVLPQYVPGIAIARRTFEAGDADLALWATDSDPSLLRARHECGGQENYTGHCSRLVTRELDNAERVLDERSQAGALNRADRLLARDVPVLPLFQVPTLVAHRASIRNLDPDDVLWNAENWWLDR